MIEVFLKGNEDYTKNGDSTLFPTYCNVTPELNKVWLLELEHPIDSYGKWKYIAEGNRLRVNSFNGEQLFSIIKVKKSDSGVYAKAYPVFMESAGDCILLDTRPVNKNGQEALDIILRSNDKYSASSNITKTATSYYVLKNAMEAITNEENGFLTRWGGEIYFNNYEIIINERVGGDYGVSILYGKNLKTNGLSETVDIENVVTRIIPKAFNGYILPGSTPWVDSEYIDAYPTIKTKVIEYSNIRLASDVTEEDTSGLIVCQTMSDVYDELRKAANAEYENGIDKPDVSIECEMVLIQNTEEYKNFKDLEFVSLGDTIYCQHDKLGITTTARVTSMVWDCLTEQVTSVKIGSKSKSFLDKITTSVNSTIKALTPNGSVIADQVLGIIDGSKAQLRVQNTIAKKQDVRAILFEDLDPQSPTFGASSYGTQGWQISKKRTADGRDWEWTTAATASGIIADTVVAGILTDQLGRNYWNLSNGDFRLVGAKIEESDIEGYATDTELGAVDTKAGNAQSTANSAVTKADNAQGTANTAVTKADNAQGTANSAVTKADNAQGTANTAVTNAATAQSTANTAVTKADNAQSTANTAVTNAATAQSTADIAITRLNGQYGTCTSASGSATKVVTLTNANNFELFKGATIAVKFSNTNSVASPQLKVGNTDAKPIYVKGSAISSTYYWSAGSTVTFVYNGSQWEMQTDDQQMTFNHLTDGGTIQGIYMENGKLYVNASYLKGGYIIGDVIQGHSINVDKITGTLTDGTWGIDFLNGKMTIGTLAVGNITGILGDNTTDGGSYINFDTDTVVVRKLNANAIVTGTLTGVTISGDTIKVGGKSGDTTGKGGAIYVYNEDGTQIGKWDKNGISVTSGTISGGTITSSGTYAYTPYGGTERTYTDTASFQNGRLVVSSTDGWSINTARGRFNVGDYHLDGSGLQYKGGYVAQYDELTIRNRPIPDSGTLSATSYYFSAGFPASGNVPYIEWGWDIWSTSGVQIGANAKWTPNLSYGSFEFNYTPQNSDPIYRGDISPIVSTTISKSYVVGSSTSTMTWHYEYTPKTGYISAWATGKLSSSASATFKSATIPLPQPAGNTSYQVFATPIGGLTSGIIPIYPVRIINRYSETFTCATELKEASSSNVDVMFHVHFKV